ncbi:MAG: WbqC family protein [Candidatus Bathyarchaeota archaeon]|nr:WbqC family protein [Candidatus Bathyarchaeota archaeon]
MIAAGHQPNYLPYLGFFDKIRRSDIFIIEDAVQFEQQGFTNRNRVLTSDGVRWLSVPIKHAKKPLCINEIEIATSAEANWRQRHWLTLKHNYCKAPYWSKYADFFEDTYQREWTMLIDLNMHLIRGIMGFLHMDKPIVFGSSLTAEGKKTELIIAQCKQVGADTQLSGNGCHDYIDKELFEKAGIKLVFQNFNHPQYTQTCSGFVPNLSVVDYLFCTGAESW